MARRRRPGWKALGAFFAILLFVIFVLRIGEGRRGGLLLAPLQGDAVGVVQVVGTITDSKETIEALKQHEKADSVKAVVVRIESPGGGVAAAQEIYEEIGKLKKKKPVVASLGGVAASGGYYIASNCDTIVANPGTITGSIGVIVHLGNVEELLQKIGLQGYTIKSAEHKDMGSPLKKLNPSAKNIFQDVVNNIHSQFVQAVADGRKLDRKQVERLADGRIYTGEQAKEQGLIDVLGNLEDAIQIAARKGQIKGEPRVVISEPDSEGLLRRLLLGKVMDMLHGLLFSAL